jgi:hypothetical protein
VHLFCTNMTTVLIHGTENSATGWSLMQVPDLHPSRSALLLVSIAGIVLQACAVSPIRPAGDWPANRKEFDMQPAPQKSRPPVPETVGATSVPIVLGKGVTATSFEIHAPSGPALLRADGQPKRVLLRLENVKSTMQAPSFDVYLNVPPGADPESHPELRAFTMSTFGLSESSRAKGDHPGNGLSIVREVTGLYTHLSTAKNWDGKTLGVSFVPEPWGDYPVKVTVGRISLVIE